MSAAPSRLSAQSLRARAAARSELDSRQHRGMQIRWKAWLRRNLPLEDRDDDNCRQYVDQFSYEAADMYQPEHGAKFSTYLFAHLQLRCRNLQQSLWVRSSGNKHYRKRQLPECMKDDDGVPPATRLKQFCIISDPSAGLSFAEYRVDHLIEKAGFRPFTFSDQKRLPLSYSAAHSVSHTATVATCLLGGMGITPNELTQLAAAVNDSRLDGLSQSNTAFKKLRELVLELQLSRAKTSI